MILALILFIIMYAFLLAKPDYRWITALVTAGVFVILGILPISEVIPAVNWNILLMPVSYTHLTLPTNSLV